nr:MAG TPA: hypothetical protein [Caudoviricetes sp.]
MAGVAFSNSKDFYRKGVNASDTEKMAGSHIERYAAARHRFNRL